MDALLILSGGRSSRMGRDKAQLELHSQTLLEWQSARFQQAGFNVVHSVADNFAGFLGPLAGIEAALSKHPEVTRWFVIAVDMPLISPSSLTELSRRASLNSVVASFKKQPLPLLIQQPALLRQRLADWLSDPNGPRAIRALMDAFTSEELANEIDLEQFENINTPEQWRSFIDEDKSNEP